MFGYITPRFDELKVREYQFYKSIYCGLCKELDRQYGFAGRMLLNYDLVLVALLADGLKGVQPGCSRERCIVHPIARRPVCGCTPGITLAADALILLGWYKLQDDLMDEGFLRRIPIKIASFALKGAYRKAAARRSEMDNEFREAMQMQNQLEQAGCSIPDQASDPSAKILGALFAQAADSEDQRPSLYRCGMLVGRMIYYLDAAEDYPYDEKKNRYNVFLREGLSSFDAQQRARVLCNLCAGEAIESYRQLKIKENQGVLDNLFYLGLAESIARIGCPKKKKRSIKNERPL